MNRRPSDIDTDTDRQLVEAANRGDEAAFEALYRRYRDWVVSLAFRFTKNREDALDVLQDTFTYFWGKFPGFRLEASLRSFLYPVVKSQSLQVLRHRTRRAATAEGLDDVPGGGPESRPLDDLAAVLEKLKDEHRETLLLRFVDGMSLAEIATALDVPVGTVKSRLHHALKTLREDRRTQRYFLE